LTSQKEYFLGNVVLKKSATAFTLINLDRFTFNVQTFASLQCATQLRGMQKRDTEAIQKQWKWQIFAAKWQILAPNPCLKKLGSTLLANRKYSWKIQFVLCGHSLI